MAINKIVAPLATAPNVFAAPVINHLNAHAINVNPIIKIANDYVKKGALFNIGGELFYADADTAISGSSDNARAVKLVVSGNSATAIYAYYADLSDVIWNGEYHGWYDVSGNFYEMLYRPEADSSYNKIPSLYALGRTGRVYPANSTATINLRSEICGTVAYHCVAESAGIITYKIKKNGITLYEGTTHPSPLYFINPNDILGLSIRSTKSFVIHDLGFYGYKPLGM